jgi:hypothetical protein
MKLAFFLALSSIISVTCFCQSQKNTDELVLTRTNKESFPSERIRPVVLPDGRMIVSVADTVYMLSPKRRVLWKYANAELTSEPVFNAGLNEVAVVGYDLLFVRLDAATGKVKWKADSNGGALFAEVRAYGKGYLVVVNMTAYREKDKDLGLRPSTPDGLDYWGESEEDFWTIAFPTNAELVVDGKRVFALRRRASQVRLQELHIPPMGKHAKL